MQKELIFEKMNGFLVEDVSSRLELKGIEDEFAEGKECWFLYEGVYQAGRNLCERLGKDADEDVEALLNGMERIARILAMKMYEYGKCRGGMPCYVASNSDKKIEVTYTGGIYTADRQDLH